MRQKTMLSRYLTLGLSVTLLANCSEPLNVSVPKITPTSERAEPVPDERGVITFPNYRVAIVRDGDSMDSLARRVGISTIELANLNGLSIRHPIKPGDRILLPEGRIKPRREAEPGFDATRIGETLDGVADTPPPEVLPLPSQTTHVVESGETAFSIARLYDVSATALASANRLGSEFEVRAGQVLVIPVGVPEPEEEPAPEIQDTEISVGTPVPIEEPPSAEQPLPEDIPNVEPPESPDLAANPTSERTSTLLKPVEGSVLRPYSTERGANKNEGIDFAAPVGAPVVAADDGEVALVSPSVGNVGTIILIRHADDLLTVYGRVANVSVVKGQAVRRGEPIATVGPGSPPNLHFEVRRGVDSVDPTPFL